MSDGMSDAAWEEQRLAEERTLAALAKQNKRKINDITPAEWDEMARRGRETQDKFDAMQKQDEVDERLLKYVADRKKELSDRKKEASDGSTASYYELPKGAAELQDLISAKNMNAQIGEIFRECYRYGQASHSDELRGIKKIIFYAQAELKRIENSHGNAK